MSEPQTIALGDSLDMNAAGPLATSLRERRGQPIALDGSAVRRIGGQCLQVLISAQTAWAADGQAFQIIEPSPELSDGLALLGAPDLGSVSLVQD